MEEKVVFVMLRRPERRDPSEKRSDPFWEFGSFGCTGCHRGNLMNVRKADRLNGLRLAFAQGGDDGFRLVYVTPPIRVRRLNKIVEAYWKPQPPFRYGQAPLLINNHGESDVLPADVIAELRRGRRLTLEGQFASRFRARSSPLPAVLARRIIERFERGRVRGGKAALATSYVDALPSPPPCIDKKRAATYQALAGRRPKARRC